jgi:hypothetical protein
MVNLDSITRRFIVGEGKAAPTVRGYVESIINIIETIRPRSQRESRQLSIAKAHLREVKRMNRKLEEKVQMLEEQINILEEGKD